MRKLSFSADALAPIRFQRFSHPHPRSQQKLLVLWLQSKTLPHAEITRLTGLGRRTLQRYFQEYHQGGLAAPGEVRFAKPHSDLQDHVERWRQHFASHPPRRTRFAQRDIERLTGSRRGLTQVRLVLEKPSV